MFLQYNSYQTHYKEAECLRQMVEPFLYNFGVDVVFHGEPYHYPVNHASCTPVLDQNMSMTHLLSAMPG